jgi:serine protease Do
MARWSIAAAALLVGGAAGVFLAGPLLPGEAPTPTQIPKELTSYHPIVEKVLPAVVTIESKARPTPRRPQMQRRRIPSDDQGIPPEFRRFFQDFGKDFDRPQPQQFGDDEGDSPYTGLGSGFVVDPQGVILTNYHVVDGADEVDVYFMDGKKFTSRDIKTDPKTDLAIVRVKTKQPLPYLQLGDSGAMQIGDRVLAVGAPFGLSGSVTAGIVSAKDRSLHMNMYEDFLQTDAAINPGNSGGPLINLAGQVIGINSAIKSRSGGWQGVGMAISSNLAKSIMEQLLKNGVVRRGYLGIHIKNIVDPALAKKLGVKKDGGVLVTDVLPNGPSEKAGLKEWDVITSVDGKKITDSRELQNVIAGLPTGKTANLEVVRDGKSQELHVKIAEQPADMQASTETPAPRRSQREPGSITLDRYGMELSDLTPDLADELGYRESAKGAVITRVDRNGPAAEQGLRSGMLITKVERQRVTSARDVRDRLRKASPTDGALVQVQTPGGESTIVVLKPTAKSSENK